MGKLNDTVWSWLSNTNGDIPWNRLEFKGAAANIVDNTLIYSSVNQSFTFN